MNKLFLKAGVIGLIAGLVAILASIAFHLGPLGALASSASSEAFSGDLSNAPLTVNSSPQDILTLMNRSHTTWSTLEAQVSEVHRDPDGTEHWGTMYLQFAPEGKAYAEMRSGEMHLLWISDGQTVLEESLNRGEYTTFPVTASEREALEEFDAPSSVREGNITLHPMSMRVPAAPVQLLYPTGIAQNILYNGELTVLGEEVIAERNTIKVLREHFVDGMLVKKHIYWVDAQTGIIIKAQFFAEATDTWVEEMSVTEIHYDSEIPAQVFELAPSLETSRHVERDVFSH